MTRPTRAHARVERQHRIVAEARAIAELEDWQAVTVRRLADAIGYSQPVLYGHFPDGRDGIVRAVALDGFERLAVALNAPPRSTDAARRVRAVIQRYLTFAHDNPATYAAMFSMPTDLPFATNTTPQPLRQSFAAIERALPDSATDRETMAETLWSAMHGLADLQRFARLRPSQRAQRVRLLTRLFSDAG